MRRKGQAPSEYGHSSVSSSISCAALRHGCSHGQLFCHCQIGRIRKTPVKASADSPKCFWESRRSCGGVGTPPSTMRCCEFAGCGGHPKRPHPFPPPAGEGAAHKGGRGRTWRDRNVEMTATGGYATNFTVCKRSRSPSSVIRLAGDRRMPPSPAGGRKWRLRIRRTWRLSSVLLPGAPGSARPTIDGCGFAGGGACLWRCCRGVGTPPPTIKCCGFAGDGGLSSVLLRNRPRAGRRSLQILAFMRRWVR